MAYYLLRYAYVDNYHEARTPYREAHLQAARIASERGELRLGGVSADPPWEATLIFDVDDPSVIEEFVAGDPYVQHGVVKEHRIDQWDVAVGADLQTTD